MQPHPLILNNLLNPSARKDALAQPNSITILKEQKIDLLILYIVTNINTQQQQIYACISVRQTETSIRGFAGFLYRYCYHAK